MTDKRLKWRTALVTATVTVALIVMSCEAPRPEPIAPGVDQKSAEPKHVVVAGDALLESQVEKPVSAAAGFVNPRYPEILRQAGVEGEVLVSFVVDENGRADQASLKVIRATHELFATAVRNALPTMRFNPAEVGGEKVKQLVEQPFAFTLPGAKAAASRGERTAENFVERKKPARTTIRWHDGPLGAEDPSVIVYTFEGVELARSERDADLLKKIEPSSIHSIDVIKGKACAPSECPLIKIRLAKGKTLGETRVPLTRDQSYEPKRELPERRIETLMSSKMTVELLDSRGDLVRRWDHRPGIGTINSEDISASAEYSGRSCKAGSACPLTRIWLKPGREAAYKKI